MKLWRTPAPGTHPLTPSAPTCVRRAMICIRPSLARDAGERHREAREGEEEADLSLIHIPSSQGIKG